MAADLAPYNTPLMRINSRLRTPLTAQVLSRYLDRDDLEYGLALCNPPSDESPGVVVLCDDSIAQTPADAGHAWWAPSVPEAVAILLHKAKVNASQSIQLTNDWESGITEVGLAEPDEELGFAPTLGGVLPVTVSPADLKGRRRIENALAGLREGERARWIKALDSLGVGPIQYESGTANSTGRSTPIRTPQSLAQSFKQAIEEGCRQSLPLHQAQELLAQLLGVKSWQHLLSRRNSTLGAQFMAVFFRHDGISCFESLSDALWAFVCHVRKCRTDISPEYLRKEPVGVSFEKGELILRFGPQQSVRRVRAPCWKIPAALRARAVAALEAQEQARAQWLKTHLADRAQRLKQGKNLVLGPWELVRSGINKRASLRIINLDLQLDEQYPGRDLHLEFEQTDNPRECHIVLMAETAVIFKGLSASQLVQLVRYVSPVVAEVAPVLVEMAKDEAFTPEKLEAFNRRIAQETAEWFVERERLTQRLGLKHWLWVADPEVADVPVPGASALLTMEGVWGWRVSDGEMGESFDFKTQLTGQTVGELIKNAEDQLTEVLEKQGCEIREYVVEDAVLEVRRGQKPRLVLCTGT